MSIYITVGCPSFRPSFYLSRRSITAAIGSSAAGSVIDVIGGGSRQTCLCVYVCSVYSACIFCGSDNRAKRRGSSTAAGEFFRFSGGDGCDAEFGRRTHVDRSAAAAAAAAARHAERHRNVELHVRDSQHHRVHRDRHYVRNCVQLMSAMTSVVTSSLTSASRQSHVTVVSSSTAAVTRCVARPASKLRSPAARGRATIDQLTAEIATTNGVSNDHYNDDFDDSSSSVPRSTRVFTLAFPQNVDESRDLMHTSNSVELRRLLPVEYHSRR